MLIDLLIELSIHEWCCLVLVAPEWVMAPDGWAV
jgi:hypothetical protein